jgi:hypothetical protein
MVEVTQDLQSLDHQVVGLAALDVGHKADATGVVLVTRVIQTLPGGQVVALRELNWIHLKYVETPL